MAFTDDQKSKIRLYLGQQDLYRFINTRFETAMTSVSTQAQTEIIDLLGRIDTLDAKLDGVVISGAGVKRVDEVEFFGAQAQGDVIRSRIRELVMRIASLLGVKDITDPTVGGGGACSRAADLG